MTNRYICLFIILACIVSCKKADPNPELSDKIYLDLVKDQKQFADAALAAEKEIEAAQKSISTSLPGTLDLKNARGQLLKAEHKKTKMTEMAEYLNIRIIKRSYEVNNAYIKAFHAGKPWPPAGEFEGYMSNKKLHEDFKAGGGKMPKAPEVKTSETKSEGGGAEAAAAGGGH